MDAELPELGRACECYRQVIPTVLWDDADVARRGSAGDDDGAGDKEAWMEGGRWAWGGDVGSERWSESGSDLEESG